jgi:hypothetical protein
MFEQFGAVAGEDVDDAAGEIAGGEDLGKRHGAKRQIAGTPGR